MHINKATILELKKELKKLREKHKKFIESNLELDLTRGKPSTAQLNLASELLETVNSDNAFEDNIDLRNYGVLDGLPSAKKLFGSILEIPEKETAQRVFIGGNSSLSLMHDTVSFAYYLGLKEENIPWIKELLPGQKVKMLCPSPGYDRHFSLCSQLGIEMIPVSLTGNGPNMDEVEALVKKDPTIKGIWCVPRFANPTGEVYNEDTVNRIAALGKHASQNFLVLWDNAYAVHSLNDGANKLASIDSASEKYGTSDCIIQFGSTSKITFAGAGIAFLASSENNIKGFKNHFGKTSIGSDKINQARHVRFLKNLDGVNSHMKKHGEIIGPKFKAVLNALENNLKDSGMGEWSNPEGGYFVSFDTLPGLAKKVVLLAGEAGVKLTPAGATFPEGKDPHDKNIRLAPTYPELNDVKKAMEVFINCVKLASIERKVVN